MTDITDIHTHVLPGIDDGAPNWEICRQMLAQSAACGVNRIIATPHYLPWKKNVSAAIIRELCRKVQDKLQEETGLTIRIYPGHEIYYHEDIVESLRAGKALTLADSRYVLVEFSTRESYSTICRAVQKLREAGYIPILAHVERYRNLQKSKTSLKELHDMGALFQMNVEVLELGIFHPGRRWAKAALEQEQIHFLASDMHNLQTRPPMNRERIREFGKYIPREYRRRILCGSSDNILRGSSD